MKLLLLLILLICSSVTSGAAPSTEKMGAVCGVNYSNETAVTSFPMEGMSLSVVISLESKALLSVNCTYLEGELPLDLKRDLLSFYTNIPNMYSLEIVDENVDIVMLRREDGDPVIKKLVVFQLSQDGRRFIVKDDK